VRWCLAGFVSCAILFTQYPHLILTSLGAINRWNPGQIPFWHGPKKILLSWSLRGSVSYNDESFLEARGMCFAFRVRPDAMIPSCQHSCYLECRSLKEARICSSARQSETGCSGWVYVFSLRLFLCVRKLYAYYQGILVLSHQHVENISFVLLVLNRRRFHNTTTGPHQYWAYPKVQCQVSYFDNAGTGGPTIFKIIH
jgi:hypothetical protein